jgi:hypothetical protein
MKSDSPVRKPAPTTLAAGPDKMVSTGYSSAISAFISDPSPFTIINGASMDSRSSTRQGLDEVTDLGGEPRVQRRRERAPRGVEFRAQLMSTGNGLGRQGTHQLARPQFMRRIAHREICGDGESLDAGFVVDHRMSHCGLVQFSRLIAGGRMTALDAHDQAAAARPLQTGALYHGVIETDQQRADGAEAAFDHGIGREGGRYRHQADVPVAAARRKQLEHGADCFADADGEIPRRRERFCTRDDPAAVGKNHGVGKRASRVQAEP